MSGRSRAGPTWNQFERRIAKLEGPEDADPTPG